MCERDVESLMLLEFITDVINRRVLGFLSLSRQANVLRCANVYFGIYYVVCYHRVAELESVNRAITRCTCSASASLGKENSETSSLGS